MHTYTHIHTLTSVEGGGTCTFAHAAHVTNFFACMDVTHPFPQSTTPIHPQPPVYVHTHTHTYILQEHYYHVLERDAPPCGITVASNPDPIFPGNQPHPPDPHTPPPPPPTSSIPPISPPPLYHEITGLSTPTTRGLTATSHMGDGGSIPNTPISSSSFPSVQRPSVSFTNNRAIMFPSMPHQWANGNTTSVKIGTVV